MKKLIFLTLSFFVNTSEANTSKIKMYQYYINGINTTRQEADKNTENLNKYLNSQNHVNGNLISPTISLLYNEKPSPIELGVFKQIMDSLLQKSSEKYNFELEDIIDSVMEVYGFIYPKNSEEYINLSNSVKKYLNDLTDHSGFNFDKILEDFEKQSGITSLKAAKDKYFVIIGHSQGNLYANELVFNSRSQIPPENFALLQIATPASSVNGFDWNPKDPFSMGPSGAKNVTSMHDIIRKTPNSLPAGNYQEYIDPEDKICHSLILTYLKDSYLKLAIINSYRKLITSFIEHARQNSPTYEMNGIKSVILNNYQDYPYYQDYLDRIYVFLNDEQEYSVNSLVSSTVAPGLDIINAPNYDIINSSYSWDCVLGRDENDEVIWKSCTQCIETTNQKYTGISMCDKKLLGVSQLYTFSEILIEAKAVQDNTYILTNKFRIIDKGK